MTQKLSLWIFHPLRLGSVLSNLLLVLGMAIFCTLPVKGMGFQ